MVTLIATLFFFYPPIRNVQALSVIVDVECRLPAGHPYSDADPITTVHEGTHGINSRLRSEYRRPGFYVLQGRAVLLREPRITLDRLTIPPPLQGAVHQLYLVNSRRWWNNQPSYVWDEYVAYTNGSEAREQLHIVGRQETVLYMVELLIYSNYIPYLTGDIDCREFLRWQNERALGLYHRSGVASPQLLALRSNPTLQSYRAFLRYYYGDVWCKIWLGI